MDHGDVGNGHAIGLLGKHAVRSALLRKAVQAQNSKNDEQNHKPLQQRPSAAGVGPCRADRHEGGVPALPRDGSP